jgi:hypothetical protein
MATLEDFLNFENNSGKRRRSKKTLADEVESYAQNLPSPDSPELDFDSKNLTPTQFRDKYANPSDLVSRPNPEADRDNLNLTPLELYRKYSTPMNALAPTLTPAATNALAAPYQLQMLRAPAPLQTQASQLQTPLQTQALPTQSLQMTDSVLNPNEEMEFMQWARQTNNIKHMFDPTLRQLWKTNYQVRG